VERIVGKLAAISLLSIALYIMLGFKSALMFSSLIAISILTCGLFSSLIALSKFGSQVTAEIDVNFYELILLISSLGILLIVLVTLI
jgi:hypothetical protein